ncbi:MAG: hypothetical protein MJ156_02790 [Alphaproteobacteria bacterium]|nr:hypothetical protein [Alphaproteobacteria bacterium]
MREDEKMLHIGVVSLITVFFVLTPILGVCYRVQNRNLNHINAEIKTTKQNIAALETEFTRLRSSEVLRNFVFSVVPKAEMVTFNKTIKIEDIPVIE